MLLAGLTPESDPLLLPSETPGDVESVVGLTVAYWRGETLRSTVEGPSVGADGVATTVDMFSTVVVVVSQAFSVWYARKVDGL